MLENDEGKDVQPPKIKLYGSYRASALLERCVKWVPCFSRERIVCAAKKKKEKKVVWLLQSKRLIRGVHEVRALFFKGAHSYSCVMGRLSVLRQLLECMRFSHCECERASKNV